MKAHQSIITKQILWAKRNRLELTGSKGSRGIPAYTKSLEDNLFEPLLQVVREDISNGDGGELNGNSNSPAKMHAVHSSSALGINIFQYWKRIHEVPTIASACGFCSEQNKMSVDIKFECKFPIHNTFTRSPNIDVVIENNQASNYKVFAIECKFSEAYAGRQHGGIDPKYFIPELDSLWKDIPRLHALAKSISPDDSVFNFLHAAQLIKHILGLKREYGKTKFKLLYLWYDALGEEGLNHRKEIEKFAEITAADKIQFLAQSYQELIEFLGNKYHNTNEEYINYIVERYL